MAIVIDGQANDILVNGTSVATDAEVTNAVTTGTSGKQNTLVSGTSIKTINGVTVLGSGDLVIQGFTLAQAHAVALSL